MKPVLRFFSMNFFRASCSDAKREYIGPTRGWAPSSRLILRLYRQWRVRTSALVLLKTSVNSWYSEGILERSEASASFVKLAWMSEEQRQSSKLWEPKSFDMCKNAVTPMITMLGCSELDTEVSDAGIETVESNDCRRESRKDGDANGVLAAMWEGVRFFCKDRQKFINSFTQSISGLCWASQLYPRTKEQEKSSRVT